MKDQWNVGLVTRLIVGKIIDFTTEKCRITAMNPSTGQAFFDSSCKLNIKARRPKTNFACLVFDTVPA